MEESPDWVVFEHPLTERIRYLLRLDFLFAQSRHHLSDRTPWGLRSSVHTLLDILSVMGRTDQRTELVKDLCEQQTRLGRLLRRPEISPGKLHEVLRELGGAIADVQAMTTSYPAMGLRENEFLFSVLNRSSIPGGTCGFDLPAYHRWLSRPPEQVQKDIQEWCAILQPLERAIELYLRLLRNSTQPVDQSAEAGVYLQVPEGPCQLVRVLVPVGVDVYPEISAGKHRISVRFMSLGDVNTRNVQTAAAVNFRLQCCHLA